VPDECKAQVFQQETGMIIKILGPGCIKCQQLERTTNEVVKELGIDAVIADVRDIKKIMQYPILATPGLVIDEKLVVSGRVPTKAEVTKFITTALPGG
jgi:small redox-active disulfide protein 2